MSVFARIRAFGLGGVRRIVVAGVGLTILGVGALLLVLPGPAFLVIPIGLAVLGIEFEWARRWLRRAREVWSPPQGPDPR